MPRKAKPKLQASEIQGLKYFHVLDDLLVMLRDGEHGNRDYHFDQHVMLLLLTYFNPSLESLRSLQQATDLEKVQRALGVRKMSLGAMSEAASSIFDPTWLRPIIAELMRRCQGNRKSRELAQIVAEVVAVDGSFMRCVPSMTWALFRRGSVFKGVKLHTQLNLRTDVPEALEVTSARGSERASLKRFLRESVLYVLDRGYADYELFQQIHDVGSFFVARVKDNSSLEVKTSRPLSKHDRAANVVSDDEVIVGSRMTKGKLVTPVRRVVIETKEQKTLVILTNEMTVSAETIGTLYRCRWQVELFFRWFKCVLGCRHWTSRSESGVTLQIYVAMIASLLISLWTGRKPTKRTYEMICLYIQGWATESDLRRHLQSLPKSA